MALTAFAQVRGGMWSVTDPLVEVFRGNHFQAGVIASMLESNGIHVNLVGSGASAAYPLGVGALGEGRVLVLVADEAIARELIGGTSEEAAASDLYEGPA